MCTAGHLSYKQPPPLTLVHSTDINSFHLCHKNLKVRKFSSGLWSSFQPCDLRFEAITSSILSSLDRDGMLFLSLQDLLEEGVGLFSITFSFKDREKRGDDRRERKQKSVRAYLPVS